MSSFNIKEDVSWRDFLIRTGLIICTVAIITWFMPRDNRNNFKVEKGKPWSHTELRAPFNFPIYKSDEAVKSERDSLMRTYEPYFNYNKETEAQQIRKFAIDYNNGIPGLPEGYTTLIANILSTLYEKGIMSSTDFSRYNKDTLQMIRVVKGKSASSKHIKNIYSTVSAYEELVEEPELIAYRELLMKCNLNDYIIPNLTYDKERSEASLNDLLNSIPLASGIVQRGQKIIDRGDIVDAKTYDILLSYQKEQDRREKSDQQISITILGQILYVTIIVVCFTIFLTLFRKDYFEKPRSVTMLFSLIIAFSVIASLMVSNNVMHVYIIPFVMVPIFIRVFMDSRTAFMAHCTMILICACILQHPLEFIAVELIAGLVAIYSLRELSSRSQLFWTAVLVTIDYQIIEIAYINLSEIVVANPC